MKLQSTRLLFAALALALAACGSDGQAGPAKPNRSEALPLPADVARLAEKPSPSLAAAAAEEERAGALAATGEFVSPARSELSAKLTGRVGRILVDEGARVARGDALLELESDYLRLEAERAEAEASRARAAEDEARRDFERKKDLVAKGSVPQSVFDRSNAAHDQAQAASAAAQASLALTRQRLSDAVLVSPVDGVVMERRVDVGERLGDNTVAFVVVQTEPLKLRFRVPERYLGQVRPGQPVRAAVDPYPGRTFEGRVAVVVRAVDTASRTFGVEAEFGNRDGRLAPGLFARVELDMAPPPAAAPTTTAGNGEDRAQAR